MRKIFIYRNDTPVSKKTKECLIDKLEQFGFSVCNAIDEETELVICIGGDGTFLELLQSNGFPSTPIVGINTGHLGFFQEIQPEQIEYFLNNYLDKKFTVQKLNAVKATIRTDTKEIVKYGLNEIAVKGPANYPTHLNISIGGSFIERFSGDGILIATPAGSTAYNYSLGGSIVDPRLKLLQVTPMAPMNTIAYRSFMSSVLLPYDLTLDIRPELQKGHEQLEILYDGFSTQYNNIEDITISYSDKNIHLLRLENYDFWSKVKSKFL